MLSKEEQPIPYLPLYKTRILLGILNNPINDNKDIIKLDILWYYILLDIFFSIWDTLVIKL